MPLGCFGLGLRSGNRPLATTGRIAARGGPCPPYGPLGVLAMTQRGLCPSLDLRKVLAAAQLPALPQSAIRLLELVAGPGHGRDRTQRPHRSRRRVDQPSPAFCELVLLRVFAADCQFEDGHHPGGNPHHPGLRPLERGLQPDARSKMRPLRPQGPLAGFVAAGPAGAGDGQIAGHGRRRRTLCGRPVAGHGDSRAGGGCQGALQRLVAGPRRSGRCGFRTWKRRSSAGPMPTWPG